MQPAEASVPASEPAVEPQIAVVDPAQPPPDPTNSGTRIQPFDFRQPAPFTGAELRKLRACHEEFLHAIAARLASYLRVETDLKIASLEPGVFRSFTAALPTPAHLTLFRVDPLRGIGVLDLNLGLALAMSDRLMGGAGKIPRETRELSEIETALLDQVVLIFVESWAAQWPKCQIGKPALLGHENDGRYLQAIAPDASVLIVKIDVRLGETKGTVQMVFPFRTLEPIFRHIRQAITAAVEFASEPTAPKSVAWNKALEDLPIDITAELPALELPARRVLQLKVGDTLPLPADFASRVQIRLAGLPRFRGRLGKRDNQWAIEVANVLKT